MNLNNLLIELNKAKININLRELQILTFETKADIYCSLVQGVNPKSKLLQLITDCQKVMLPSRQNISQSQQGDVFTIEDYQQTFYEYLSQEVQAINIEPSDLKLSKEVNYNAIRYLLQKYKPERLTQYKEYVKKMDQAQTEEQEQEEKKLFLQQHQQIVQKQIAKQQKQKPPSTKQKPEQQAAQNQQLTYEQMLKAITEKSQNNKNQSEICLELLYIEQLYLKCHTMLNLYQQRLENITRSLVHIESSIDNSSQYKQLKESIQYFYNAHELDFDVYYQQYEQIRNHFNIKQRVKNTNFFQSVIDLKSALLNCKNNNCDDTKAELSSKIESTLQFYNQNSMQIDSVWDLFTK